jgi:hypothetical protein
VRRCAALPHAQPDLTTPLGLRDRIILEVLFAPEQCPELAGLRALRRGFEHLEFERGGEPPAGSGG